MNTQIALLRGVNVGGRRMAMASLRAVLTEAGFTDVSTYLQSGNVILRSSTKGTKLGREVEAIISATFAMDVPVVVISATDLSKVITANPFPELAAAQPKLVHAVFYDKPPAAAVVKAIDDALTSATEAGSQDEVTVVGRVAYLSTPDGFGRSRLVEALSRGGRNGPLKTGTARNWSTVTKLAQLAGS